MGNGKNKRINKRKNYNRSQADSIKELKDKIVLMERNTTRDTK